jgi:hypothetical protein
MWLHYFNLLQKELSELCKQMQRKKTQLNLQTV